jgi:hypothetical protein
VETDVATVDEDGNEISNEKWNIGFDIVNIAVEIQ